MSIFTRWRDKKHPPYTTKEGYKQVYEPRSAHARASGYAPEHILVAESKAKRSAKPNEVVHHIDGNKSNNRPSNLKIMTRSTHYKTHVGKSEGKRK